MSHQPLAGLRLLLLEDEFLIAMDVEQLCRDNGAQDVIIRSSLAEMPDGDALYDAAIIDLMLGGESTIAFASGLYEKGIPFIFASGYVDRSDIAAAFPDVRIVGKPYAGDDLVAAIAEAIKSKSRQG